MLSVQYWLSLTPETRKNIAAFLGIPRSGTMVVESHGSVGRVVSDGYTPHDLSKITLEHLCSSLGEPTLVELGVNTENFYDMFSELVRRVELPVVTIDISESTIVKKPFCDTCDSLGVRHKKICPAY